MPHRVSLSPVYRAFHCPFCQFSPSGADVVYLHLKHCTCVIHAVKFPVSFHFRDADVVYPSSSSTLRMRRALYRPSGCLSSSDADVFYFSVHLTHCAGPAE